MTTDTLNDIKAVAKRLARVRRIQHIAALEAVAAALGQPHWRGLAEAAKKGWRPASGEVEALQRLFETEKLVTDSRDRPSGNVSSVSALGDGLTFTRWAPAHVAPMDADEIHGELDGHSFYLVGDEFEVGIGGRGWEITLDQPPSAKPVVRVTDRRLKSVPVQHDAFRLRAIQLLEIRARRMHAEVASDWPRRSTMPDKDGNVQHPLGRGIAKEWHCLHCDAVIAGPKLAANLWHCPECGATPIDMFSEPFFLGEKQAS